MINKIETTEALVALLVPALQVIMEGGPSATELRKAESVRNDVMVVAKAHDIVDLVVSEARAKL
jgi:hypothetical protein